ncbi:MAG: hypothetical protein ACUVSH_06760 [Anaerolineae bacterium]
MASASPRRRGGDGAFLFFLGAAAAILGPALWPAYLRRLAATARYNLMEVIGW